MVAELERLTRSSSGRAVGAWLPLLLGSIATLASIGVIDLGGELGVRIYWALAGPVIGGASAIHAYTRRVQAPGRKAALAVGWAVLLLMGMLAGTAMSGPEHRNLVPAFFAAALLLGLGAIYRHAVTAWVGAGGVVVAVVTAITQPDMPDLYTWTALGFGTVGALGTVTALLAAER